MSANCVAPICRLFSAIVCFVKALSAYIYWGYSRGYDNLDCRHGYIYWAHGRGYNYQGLIVDCFRMLCHISSDPENEVSLVLLRCWKEKRKKEASGESGLGPTYGDTHGVFFSFFPFFQHLVLFWRPREENGSWDYGSLACLQEGNTFLLAILISIQSMGMECWKWRLFIKMATDWQVSEVGDTCRPAAGLESHRSVQIEWISAWTAQLVFPALLSVPHLLSREIIMNRRHYRKTQLISTYVFSGLAMVQVLIFGAVLSGGMIRRRQKSCKEEVCSILYFP